MEQFADMKALSITSEQGMAPVPEQLGTKASSVLQVCSQFGLMKCLSKNMQAASVFLF